MGSRRKNTQGASSKKGTPEKDFRQWLKECQELAAKMANRHEELSEDYDRMAFQFEELLGGYQHDRPRPAPPSDNFDPLPSTCDAPSPLEVARIQEITSGRDRNKWRIELRQAKSRHEMVLSSRLIELFFYLATAVEGPDRLPVFQNVETLARSMRLRNPHALQQLISRLRSRLTAAGLKASLIETRRHQDTNRCEYRIRMVGGLPPGEAERSRRWGTT